MKVSAAFALGALLLTACSSTLNMHGKRFDLRAPGPNCPPTDTHVANAVEVRYLGSGGVLIRWKGESIVVGPFFSNHGFPRAAAGRANPDADRVAHEMRRFRHDDVRAILAGHSHYDHLGDVALIAGKHLRHVPVYANKAGELMLRNRIPDVRSYEGRGEIRVTPFIRFRAYRHGHAPQFCLIGKHLCFDYARGPVTDVWRTWDGRRLYDLRGGEAHAFVIDLMNGNDDDDVAFRIYYNDAAASATTDLPDKKHAYDLAILCVPGSAYVHHYPDKLIDHLRPRHVLVSHYESFFSKHDSSWTFAPGLRSYQVRRFLDTIEPHTGRDGAPKNAVCGMTTEQWTLAVPRSQLFFTAR